MAEGAERALSSSLAVALILIYVLMGAVLLLTALEDPELWGREIKLLEALAPLAGAAVGWVFGREVHRKAAEDYRKDARNGLHLAGAIKGLRQDFPERGAGAESPVINVLDAERHLRRLIDQAEQLFPSANDNGYSEPDNPSTR